MGSQSKVANSKIVSIFFAEDDVFRFEVPMNDVMPGQVSKSLQDILDNYSSTILIYIFIVLNHRKNTLMTSLSCLPSKYSRMT